MSNYLYKFYDKSDNLLYVGKTKTFMKRMKQHFTNGHLPSICYARVEYINLGIFKSEVDLKIAEIKTINNEKPEYNKKDVSIECYIGKTDYEMISIERDDITSERTKLFSEVCELELEKNKLIEKAKGIDKKNMYEVGCELVQLKLKEIELHNECDSNKLLMSKMQSAFYEILNVEA